MSCSISGQLFETKLPMFPRLWLMHKGGNLSHVLKNGNIEKNVFVTLVFLYTDLQSISSIPKVYLNQALVVFCS